DAFVVGCARHRPEYRPVLVAMGRQLDASALLAQLQKTDRPALDLLYIVSGDEPLLVIETGDALRAAAARAGFGERVSLILDARSDWSALIGATQNISLFGDRRLVDVSIPSGKPGKTGSETLLKLASMAQNGGLAD